MIYQLAAPSTPEAIRQKIVTRLKSGEKIAPSQIKAVVREARKADQKAMAKAKLTPEEKKKRNEKEKRTRRSAAQREAEYEKAAQERLVKNQDARAAVEAIEMLVERFSDDELRHLVRLLNGRSHIVIQTLLGEHSCYRSEDGWQILEPWWFGRAARSEIALLRGGLSS